VIRKLSLTVNPNPVVTLSKSNDINCNLAMAELRAGGGIKYLWSPGGTLDDPTASRPKATPVVSTMYHVQVISAKGCVSSDSIRVLVLTDHTQLGFQLPSAFTPNGDGLNDCFGVKSWGAVTGLRFYIYNRWGELVFYTTDPARCWDGTYKGRAMGSEVFAYQITANSTCGKIYRNGTVTVIR
jgi:gliding motility-associated-like protein